MRIFVLGAGATGSLLAQLLERQGHHLLCGDRDLERARRFLGKKSRIPIVKVNARNLRGIVRAARGCHLIVYRNGKFLLKKRFAELEKFRFPDPVGKVRVVLAAQDEVGTLPHFIPMREMDVKIGGNEIDRLRRWQRLGKLNRSRGLVRLRFPKTPTPQMVAKLIRQGVLQNARFALAVLVQGEKHSPKHDQRLLLRSDCAFPTLYQIRRWGLFTTPIAYATAHMAALFIKHFPREEPGVFAPETLPAEIRREILAGW